MFSSAKDEHIHDRSPDHQKEDHAGDEAFVKQEQRCVHQVFDIFAIITKEESLMESKAKLNS
jgi:hypothetical protein